jgi:uncharacterized protein (TIGR02284 family)
MAEKNTQQLITTLNDLIEICKDGEKGFKTAAEGFKDSELKTQCLKYAQQRGQFAGDLQNEVQELLGGTPEQTGSVAGALHRGWIDIKSAVMKGDDNSIISEVERGEDEAKEAYEKALKGYLPPNLAGMIQRQYVEVKAVHDRFSALQAAARKAAQSIGLFP